MDKTLYHLHSFHGGGITRKLICFKGKIVVPKLLQKHMIDQYHTVLCHPGINQTEETIAQHLWWPKMSDQITNYVQPWPFQVTYDRGNEFIGQEFQQMLTQDYGIKKKPITVRNPQANAIVEKIHEIIANISQTPELEENYLDQNDP